MTVNNLQTDPHPDQRIEEAAREMHQAVEGCDCGHYTYADCPLLDAHRDLAQRLYDAGKKAGAEKQTDVMRKVLEKAHIVPCHGEGECLECERAEVRKLAFRGREEGGR